MLTSLPHPVIHPICDLSSATDLTYINCNFDNSKRYATNANTDGSEQQQEQQYP